MLEGVNSVAAGLKENGTLTGGFATLLVAESAFAFDADECLQPKRLRTAIGVDGLGSMLMLL